MWNGHLITLNGTIKQKCGDRKLPPHFLYPRRDYVVDEILPFRLADPGKLFMALPQIQQEAKGHKPRFVHGKVKLGDSVIQKPGEQLLVAYLGGSSCPAGAFFGSASLSTFRFVPRNMAAITASLYAVSSKGEVRSSTSSSVSKSFWSSLWRRL